MDDHLSRVQGLAHLWNESGIQIMVLLSFGMQVFLLVFAGTRRRKSSAFLRLSLWLVYLLADSTAIYALGHLSVASPGGSSKHQLVLFWAPFLLLHLGGPDNITAYALEDNQLWKRHLQILIVQALAAAYVTYKSMASSGALLLFLASISMFVVGLAKYGERTWALNCSRISSIRSSLRFQKIRNPCELLVAHDMSDEDILLVAHRYLQICKAIFTDFPCSLIIHGLDYPVPDAVRHYKLIEMQLSLMYDAMYTKAGVIYKWYGFCIRIVSVLGTSTAFLLFHLHLTRTSSRSAGNNKGGDVAISYVLLVGALVLEAISLCKALVSSWTRTFFTHKGHGWEWLLHALTFVGRRVQPASSLLWQGSIGQYNLFHLCTRDSNKLGSRMAKKMKLENWWNKLHFRSTFTPTVDFKEVVHPLMPLIAKYRPSATGTSILQKRVAFDCNACYYFGRDFNDSILIWSIVTEKCLHVAKDKQESNAAVHTKSCRGVPQKSQQMKDKRIQAVEVLSNYMMFLLVIKPEMLPIYRLQKAHTDLCHVFDDLWSSHGHGNDACNSSAPSRKSWNPFNVLKEQFQSLNELFHRDSPNASRIEQRKELISYMFNPAGSHEWDKFLDTPESDYLPCNIIRNANAIWKAIFDRRELSETLEILLAAWVELLVYAGEHCSRDSHVRNLTDNGGEFVTILWLMFQYYMSSMHVTSPRTGSDQDFSEDNIVESSSSFQDQDFSKDNIV